MNTISFHDTHVYPGCPVTILEKTVQNGSTASASAEFSDGETAPAELEQLSPEELIVRIDAYTTGRGTRISEKSWRLRYDKAQDIWKVGSIK